MAHKEVIFGLYNDEQDLLKAVKKAKAGHMEIMDVFTPFPIHGLDGHTDRIFKHDLDFYQRLANHIWR